MSEQTPSPALRTAAIAGIAAAAIGGSLANPEHTSPDNLPSPQAGHELVLPEVPQLLMQPSTPVQAVHPNGAHETHVTPVSLGITHNVATHNRAPLVEPQHKKHQESGHPVLIAPIKIINKNHPVTPELSNLHPEKLNIPQEVSDDFKHNTVQIPGLGCSGYLIRDENGSPIGVSTAKHCGLLPENNHWFTDTTGKPALNFATPLSVETGDSEDAMAQVGTIKQFIVNGPVENVQSDIAYGVLDINGATPEKVLAAVNAQRADTAALSQLKTGDVLYNSGFPVNQANNTGPLKRQQFAMSYIGTADWSMNNNSEHLHLILAAVPESQDGAECSYGDSGSGTTWVFNKPDGTTSIQLAGTFSAFTDFGLVMNKNSQDGAFEKQYIQDMYGVNMDGYAGVCGISVETIDPDNMLVANVITPSESISPELQAAIAAQEQQLDKDFLDPHATRHIIHGWLEIMGKESTFVKDATYSYDTTTQNLAVAFPGLGKGGGDGLEIHSFTGPEALQNLIVYGLDAQTPADITTTVTGELMPVDDVLADSFTDSNGLIVGQNLGTTAPTNLTGLAYSFSSQNGQLSINIVEK